MKYTYLNNIYDFKGNSTFPFFDGIDLNIKKIYTFIIEKVSDNMKCIKNNINDVILIIITILVVGSISVYAKYVTYAKDVGFTSSKEEWTVDNVDSALNDLYTNKDEVIPEKETTITEQEKTIEELNTSLTSKNKTISDNESTITSLTAQNESLSNSLANLDNGNCISGSITFDESCSTSTGCKLLDFNPDIFVLNITAISNNTTKEKDVIWYNNKDTSRWYGLGGIVGSADWGRNTSTKYTDRTISTDNEFYFKNIRTSWINETAYYIACV